MQHKTLRCAFFFLSSFQRYAKYTFCMLLVLVLFCCFVMNTNKCTLDLSDYAATLFPLKDADLCLWMFVCLLFVHIIYLISSGTSFYRVIWSARKKGIYILHTEKTFVFGWQTIFQDNLEQTHMCYTIPTRLTDHISTLSSQVYFLFVYFFYRYYRFLGVARIVSGKPSLTYKILLNFIWWHQKQKIQLICGIWI